MGLSIPGCKCLKTCSVSEVYKYKAVYFKIHIPFLESLSTPPSKKKKTIKRKKEKKLVGEQIKRKKKADTILGDHLLYGKAVDCHSSLLIVGVEELMPGSAPM